MIFSSLQYLIFLPIVVLLYWRTRGSARLTLIVLASYFFYMSWFPVYGVLLFLLTGANWLLGRWLGVGNPDKESGAEGYDETAHNHKHGVAAIQGGERAAATPKRKALLAAGLLLNLGCLCFFKYTNFLLENLFQFLNFAHFEVFKMVPSIGQVAPWEVPVLNVILPLGISFFVFEFVHYIVDIYYGSKPVKSFMEFTAFASFFPSQIAGPIKRYQDFVRRLRDPERFSKPLCFEAMTLILQGLMKKVAIADPIGIFVFGAFSRLQHMSSADAFIAAAGFFIQVYCDFSGYTDIGRGSALLLGIRLPENFDLPYLSRDLADFWRRWHMSLGYWLRDYVYIPLGGSRAGRFLNWRNLFLTMVACGLWHGASWHYVVFGAMQGLGLIVNREWKNLLKASAPLRAVCETFAGRCLSTAITASFIMMTFCVFRAPDLPRAFNILHEMFTFSGECLLWGPISRSSLVPLITVYSGFWLVSELAKRRPQLFGKFVDLSQGHALEFATPLRMASWTAAILLTVAARPTEAVPFVYFQF
ncbi:MAG TPA: MBOAT family O-acyltransferase [Planktothrix sp.]|jgi:D-alanyl-lipoteichoic acid acyltransferase DltB (MBOAT superfamily)